MNDILNKNIIVIDDHTTMVRIIVKLMQEVGFKKIDTATDGKEALGLIAEKDYSLIVSDWNMEPMSGLELLKKVRANARTASIPFIMVTAESKPTNVLAAKEAGVTNYIVKPFTAATMKHKLESIFGDLD
ncbi:response regulator [Sulfitobacter sp. R18_1]|uniref:response regulator n=1 Tax=Sulfitobacter sp. R18_1 TaxID=2821104 RepID=UPI001ADB7424|nr:response regulator [Sulfitobacter sp. R18_1]MBO9428457.1 response regulator [Sulfitobacter sp. R18_1]